LTSPELFLLGCLMEGLPFQLTKTISTI